MSSIMKYLQYLECERMHFGHVPNISSVDQDKENTISLDALKFSQMKVKQGVAH